MKWMPFKNRFAYNSLYSPVLKNSEWLAPNRNSSFVFWKQLKYKFPIVSRKHSRHFTLIYLPAQILRRKHFFFFWDLHYENSPSWPERWLRILVLHSVQEETTLSHHYSYLQIFNNTRHSNSIHLAKYVCE